MLNLKKNMKLILLSHFFKEFPEEKRGRKNLKKRNTKSKSINL